MFDDQQFSEPSAETIGTYNGPWRDAITQYAVREGCRGRLHGWLECEAIVLAVRHTFLVLDRRPIEWQAVIAVMAASCQRDAEEEAAEEGSGFGVQGSGASPLSTLHSPLSAHHAQGTRRMPGARRLAAILWTFLQSGLVSLWKTRLRALRVLRRLRLHGSMKIEN